MSAKPRGLGRGLDALMNADKAAASNRKKPAAKAATKKKTTAKKEPESVPTPETGVMELDIHLISVNPYQPRQTFDEQALEELTASIKELGVIQPLTVRPMKGGQTYQLIAGERRFRGSQRAGLKKVPVVVRELTDQEALEVALVENLQRHDLNVIEEAEGYQQLADEFGLTQEQIARRVGKGRATVANALRLLALAPTIRNMVADGRLSSGHAKALLAVEREAERLDLAEQAVREQWSVRETEKQCNARKGRKKTKVKKDSDEKSDLPADHVQYLTDQLHQHFGTSVRITPSKTMGNGKKTPGKLEIDFYSNDDLDRLLGIWGLSEDS